MRTVGAECGNRVFMFAARGGDPGLAEEDIAVGGRARSGADTTRRGDTKTRKHRETTWKREYHPRLCPCPPDGAHPTTSPPPIVVEFPHFRTQPHIDATVLLRGKANDTLLTERTV